MQGVQGAAAGGRRGWRERCRQDCRRGAHRFIASVALNCFRCRPACKLGARSSRVRRATSGGRVAKRPERNGPKRRGQAGADHSVTIGAGCFDTGPETKAGGVVCITTLVCVAPFDRRDCCAEETALFATLFVLAEMVLAYDAVLSLTISVADCIFAPSVRATV